MHFSLKKKNHCTALHCTSIEERKKNWIGFNSRDISLLSTYIRARENEKKNCPINFIVWHRHNKNFLIFLWPLCQESHLCTHVFSNHWYTFANENKFTHLCRLKGHTHIHVYLYIAPHTHRTPSKVCFNVFAQFFSSTKEYVRFCCLLHVC